MKIFGTADKKALGRGLSALISDNLTVSSSYGNANADNKLLSEDLPINKIRTNPNQPRKEFKVEELEELSDSIKQYGVLQPIIVRKYEDCYQLIAGERRWQAAKKAGLQFIPTIIKELSDSDILEIALVENLQREDLNAIEEATAIKKLMDENNLTQLEVSDKIGKSRSYVANSIRLLNLPGDVRDMVASGKLSPGHARNLIGKSNASKIAENIISDNLSVREVENLGKSKDSIDTNENSDLIEIEKSISSSLGMPITIKNRHGSGVVSIKFSNLNELDIIIQCLGSDGLNF